jgi:hypothetical protein
MDVRRHSPRGGSDQDVFGITFLRSIYTLSALFSDESRTSIDMHEFVANVLLGLRPRNESFWSCSAQGILAPSAALHGRCG